MEENKATPTETEQYAATLKNVTDMFESCGCQTELTASSPTQALLTIRGPVSMCPVSIFEEHVEQAKELMQSSHPEISFDVAIDEIG